MTDCALSRGHLHPWICALRTEISYCLIKRIFVLSLHVNFSIMHMVCMVCLWTIKWLLTLKLALKIFPTKTFDFTQVRAHSNITQTRRHECLIMPRVCVIACRDIYLWFRVRFGTATGAWCTAARCMTTRSPASRGVPTATCLLLVPSTRFVSATKPG